MKTQFGVCVMVIGLLAAIVWGVTAVLGVAHRFAHSGAAPTVIVNSFHTVVPPPAAPKGPAETWYVLAATYSYGSECVDVTDRVRELLSKDGVFWANPGSLHADPHPYMNKALVIFYEVQGERAVLSVGENEEVSRDRLLKNARPVPVKAVAQTGVHP